MKKTSSLDVKLNPARKELLLSQAGQAFLIEKFGDQIAKREGYKTHKGFDAVYYFLVQKYRWLPSQVRSLNWDDLYFLMTEEMSKS